MKRTALWWILCGILTVSATVLIVTMHGAVAAEYAALSDSELRRLLSRIKKEADLPARCVLIKKK